MARQLRIPFTKIHIGRFLFLLISILLFFVIRPFLTERVGIAYLMEIFLLLIFLSAVYAIRQKKSVFILALFLVLVMEILQLYSYLKGIPSLDMLSNILGGLLLAYTAAIILFHLFREDRITGDMIMGAICAYFLMGLVWAFAYSTLELFQPGSFQMPQGTVNQATFAYYSYVTLTTLGYGEITPISAPARSFAILEAMMGQLYIAVLIARLVGIHIAQSSRS
ncbi:MAG: two pore domain potassium channel family protein [Desulfobacterales bacterium]|nr:two pore domain potassium channel family protein [Desulfobacterales bacterium]